METFINRTENNYKNQEAAIKNLENQLGQLAKQIAERPQGKFPSDTIPNPKQENASVVATRSGRVMSELKKKTEGEKREEIVGGEVVVPIKVREEVDLTPETSKVPFPKALAKKSLDKKFSKFVDVFKKLHISIPFADALEQMPIYAKFMKDILHKRRRLKGVDETVLMTEECSAILQRKMPKKRRDPGSFTIPVEIEGMADVEALCDLGASINLMPLTMFERLNLGEVTPTMLSLQMADRSLKTPYGIVEDVMVRVDKYVFPVDFVVLDMEEDEKIPLILGRPFLATGRAKIDVDKGHLILRVGKEKVRFSVFNPMIETNHDNDFVCDVIRSMSKVSEEIPKVNAQIDEFHPALIKLVNGNKYGGSKYENLHAHMVKFTQASTLAKIEGVSSDEVKIKLFPHSLTREARAWFDEQEDIASWEDLLQRFCARFLPCTCGKLINGKEFPS